MAALPNRKRNARAEAILEAAEALIVREGFEALTVRGVARAAGIAPGNLGYYYPTYDHLLSAVLEHVLEPYLDNFAQLRSEVGDNPVEQLRAVLSYVLEDLGTPETTRFFPGLWTKANHSKEAAESMRLLYDAYMGVLKELIAEIRPDLAKRDVADLALFVCASIEGQTVFIGYERPYRKSRSALKQLALDSMIKAVIEK